MRFKPYNFKLQQDIDRTKMLFLLQLLCVFVGFFIEFIYGRVGWSVFFHLPFLILFYRIYYKTLTELYYTFWTFSSFVLIYILVGLVHGIATELASLFYIYFLALIFLGLKFYILSSPFYYPRIRWWEYDFRYRYDLKIKVRSEKLDLINEGRLTDLRRGAGCVILFDDFEVGDKLVLKIETQFKKIDLNAEIMSKREYSVGRGIYYGVKFHFEENIEGKDFKNFCKLWKNERIARERMKFRKKDLINVATK